MDEGLRGLVQVAGQRGRVDCGDRFAETLATGWSGTVLVADAELLQLVEEFALALSVDLIDAVAEKGECDFVAEIAAPMPLAIVCDMVGVPPSERQTVFECSNVILGVGDPEYVQTMEDLMGAFMQLFQMAMDLGFDAASVQPIDLMIRLFAPLQPLRPCRLPPLPRPRPAPRPKARRSRTDSRMRTSQT